MSPMKNNTRKYWRSRDELQQSPVYHAEAAKEFQDELDMTTEESNDDPSRRGFMGWVSAGLAASGLAGCEIIRRPEEKILPYSIASEEILPSIPQYYATATQAGGEVVGLLVESHEGRPTKLEGNPEHRSTYGALNNFQQSTIIDLYDPQRLTSPKVNGESANRNGAVTALSKLSLKGKKVAVLSGYAPSTQMHAMAQKMSTQLGASWYTYESVSDDHQMMAMEAVFGEALRPRYSFESAHAILSLDHDFLGNEGPSVAYSKEWAETRRIDKVTAKDAKLSRLYTVEARYSLTGSNADHRVRASHGQIEAFAHAVAAELGVAGASKGAVALSDRQQKAAKVIAADLKANKGHALVLAGRSQPAVVHALAAMINESLGARGTLVKYYTDYRRPMHKAGMGDMASIKALVNQLNTGVDALIILGANPVYSAPADVDFAAALKKAKQVIYLTDQANETSKALDAKTSIVIPQSHSLEAWGDLVSIDGQVSIQQPLIAPIFESMSELEVLANLLGESETSGYKIVRGAWKSTVGAVGFHKQWRRWLHAGVLADKNAPFKASTASARGLGSLKASTGASPSAENMDVLFVAGHNSYDGRFANNAWLQELPDPMTKITWDNAALLSPATAKKLGVQDEDMVSVSANGKDISSVAWVMPGQADDTVVLTLGYGRTFDNFLEYHKGAYHSKDEVGFDVTPIRNTSNAFYAAGGKVSKSGGTYDVAAVQRYANSHQEPGFDFEARALVREANIEEYKANPTFSKPGIIHHGQPMPDQSKFALLHPEERSIFGDFDYTLEGHDQRDKLEPHQALFAGKHQWGLVIDLNTCTGCNACMVACVSENNISMVGKDQVRRGREMHWIRMDRYFVGGDTEPEIVHQPIACQQCETAPCENVCPVAATVHSPEGLNDMVYNRCIGTRYCANNCPLKVRRFNFYNYAKGQPELVHMQRNPNVTVRFRGVMEKCTYCVQRINKGKRRAALNPEVAQQIIDRINPACAQGCPTQAITFGDLKNDKSEVVRLKKTARDYTLLSELNLQSRTSFLAKVRNPNPNFPQAADAEGSTQAG
jgi:MoCo/4Fe-4S cofactor protein with predicted Tat translocation signal